jgi:hypothetical protein
MFSEDGDTRASLRDRAIYAKYFAAYFPITTPKASSLWLERSLHSSAAIIVSTVTHRHVVRPIKEHSPKAHAGLNGEPFALAYAAAINLALQAWTRNKKRDGIPVHGPSQPSYIAFPSPQRRYGSYTRSVAQ